MPHIHSGRPRRRCAAQGITSSGEDDDECTHRHEGRPAPDARLGAAGVACSVADGCGWLRQRNLLGTDAGSDQQYAACCRAVRPGGKPSAGRSANPDDPELSRYASGGALTTLQDGLRAYAAKGQVLKGDDPMMDPHVTQLSPPGQPTTATITDCLDDTRFLVYDRSGEPVNDEPGGPRHAEGTVSKTAGGWLVASFGVQEPGTC
jgi:hypothetical protein